MQKKQGISLIVLVITIIVMIILAASVVITLSNTGVINRASQAVDLTNESQVQDLAALTWADAYMDNKRGTDLVNEVTTKLGEQGVTSDKWNITVTDTGVTVTNKNSGSGLGSLITAANYGDKVDYSVTVDGTTYDDWQIYYHNADYVYLIAENSVGDASLDKGTAVASLTSDELALYEKFRVGTADKFTLVDIVNGDMQAYNCQGVAQLIKDYANFANKTTYGTNVVGAIGGPTIELLAAGWNVKGYTPVLTVSAGTIGYLLNGLDHLVITEDEFYVPSIRYWLASPCCSPYDIMFAGEDYIAGGGESEVHNIRPVVCLKSSIPATVGTGDYQFSLVK